MVQQMVAIETTYKGYRFRSRLEARWAVFFDAMHTRWEYEKEGFKFSTGELYLPDFWMPDLDCWIEIKGQAMTDAERMKVGLLAAESGKYVDVFTGSPWPGDFTVTAFQTALPGKSLMSVWSTALNTEDAYVIGRVLQMLADSGCHVGRLITPELTARYAIQDWVSVRAAPQAWRELDMMLGACPDCATLAFGVPAHVQTNEWELDPVEVLVKDTGETLRVTPIRRDEVAWPDLFLPCRGCKQDEDTWVMPTSENPIMTGAYKAARSARFEHGEKP